MSRINIKDIGPGRLESILSGMGEERHRTGQVMRWLWRKGARTFDRMTDLSLELRSRLSDTFFIPFLDIEGSLSSATDRSQKFLLRCEDGERIESVLMEARGVYTVCVSTQAGCPLGCTFCRTGRDGFRRNLRADEILDQVLIARKDRIPAGRRMNIVLMGMGDPLLNPEGVSRALRILNHPDGFSLGEKRITLSTAGSPARLGRLGSSGLKFSLAISLNAVDDGLRKRLMPRAAGVEETLDAAEGFARSRKGRVTVEYVLIAGVNDSAEEARRLASLTSRRPFKINVIPFNEWEGSPFSRPSDEAVDRFVSALLPEAPAVTVRRSQGGGIGAACGQLRARREDYE